MLSRHIKAGAIAALVLFVSLSGLSAQGSAEPGTTYSYDATGRLTRVVYPGGKSVTYSYDAAGNLIAVTPAG